MDRARMPNWHKSARDVLGKGELFVWEWQYRKLGDSFNGKLADLIAKSDTGNRSSLRKAFPDYVEAIHNFQTKEGYWGSIQDRVENINNNTEK